MPQQPRIGLNYSKSFLSSKNFLCSKSLPWLCVFPAISSLYLPLVGSCTSNNQYSQPSWRGFVYEK